MIMITTLDTQATVKRTGRTWSVYVKGTLVEGGFFTRQAADHAAAEWEENTRNK